MVRLQDSIFETARRLSNQLCFRFYKEKNWFDLSFKEFKDQIDNNAAILAKLNLSKGARILLITENSPDAMIAFFSILHANAIPVLIDPSLPFDDLKNLISVSATELILISDKYWNELDLALFEHQMVRSINQQFACMQDFPILNKSTEYDPDIAAILFTSGTTGSSKGAMITHQNFLSGVFNCQKSIELTASDRMLSILPIHHISPLIQNILSLYVGSQLICIDKMDVTILFGAMQGSKPTVMGVVPLLLELFLKNIESEIAKLPDRKRKAANLMSQSSQKIRAVTGFNVGFRLFRKIQNAFSGHLTRIVCGGAPLDAEVIKKLEGFGFTIIEAYGLTETTGPACSNLLRKRKYGTVGVPFDGLKFQIENPDEKGEGEISITGPQIIKGYFNFETKTLASGKLFTGDRGYFDHDGFLKITGRMREMITLNSGKKIIPTEIEKYYENIEGIKELAIFGISSVNAAVVFDEEMKKSSSAHELESLIKQKVFERGKTLPTHFQIQQIFFVDSLPKTSLFKVKRTQLNTLLKKENVTPSITSEKSHSVIEQWIIQWIADKTATPLHSINKQEPFIYLGLNSLTILTLCEELEKFTNQSINPTLIFSYPTIEKLSAFLSKKEFTTENNHVVANFYEEPIAIVGMACKFPGIADSPESYWELFKEGQSAISNVPKERWDNQHYYSDDEKSPGKMNCCFGGFIKNIEQFDARFFEISPVEAENMDPQQRMLLELSFEALERACIDPMSLMETNSSCYVGISTNDYGLLQNNAETITPYYGIGNALSAAAGRIAYFLGLKGICKTIDTACSSSLVALHEACQSLRHGDTQLAIVGGVNSILSPLTSISFSKAKMLAPDGKCKVFDADANGYVRSEGCGVVVIKRLSDAIKEKNPILAVIAASHVNHDGRTNGITAPSGESQVQLYKKALAKANIEPNEVDYIEAHGTGTTLGDPIEVRSITEVYAKNRTRKLYVGSAKSHVGHLEAAAGMAGLIKTILAMQHQTIPKQIHLNKLNPHMELEGSSVEIPRKNIEWDKKSHRIAAVSAFGFTGTNAHIILKEVDKVASKKPSQSYYFIPLSAKTESALKQKTAALANWLDANVDTSLENLSYSLCAGRSHFTHRLAYIVNSIQELKSLLQKKSLDSKHKSGDVYLEKLTKIKENYLNGEKINWELLFDASASKLTLPTYPFERQAYWLKLNISPTLSVADIDIHAPFAMRQLITPRTNDVIYEGEISEFYPLFIKDHKIYDVPVVAGAAYLSLLHELLKTHYKLEKSEIINVKITEPLIVQKEKIILQIILASAGFNQLTFEIISRHKNSTHWQSHCVGSIHLDIKNSPTKITLSEARQVCLESFSSQKMYQAASKLELQYGPTFNFVNELWIGKNSVLATLKEAADYSPGEIDSCFQVLFAYVNQQPNQHLAVPVSINYFSIRQPHEKIFYVVAKNIHPSHNQITADFFLFNSKEVLIGEILGFVAKKAQKEMLLRKLTTSNIQPFYKIILKSAPQANDNLLQEKGTWIVINNSSPCFDSVIQALKNQAEIIQNDFNIESQAKGIIFYFDDLSLDLTANDLNKKYQEMLAPLIEYLQKFITQKNQTPLWFVLPENIFYSAFSGMLKTIALEFPHLNIQILELDEKPTSAHYAELISSELFSGQKEQHVVIKNGVRYVQRLVNLEHQSPTLLFHDKHCFRLNIKERGLIQNLAIESINPPELLEAKQVAVEIKATGLNFRDLLNVLDLYPGDPGELGSDFSGIVTAVGEGVTSLKPGDEVCGFATSGGLASHAISYEQFVTKKLPHLSFNQAATIPAAYLTAHFALNKLAKLKSSDKILIHAAAGGVGIAVIHLAKRIGATIFATAGSDTKRQFLRDLGVHHIYDSRSTEFHSQILKDTDGQGVDVVLNSLSGGDFIEKTVACCAKGARFLEIGKRDIWTPEKMNATRSDLSYHIIALDELMKKEPDFIQILFSEVMAIFAKKEVEALPVVPFHLQHSIDAFRYMQQAKHIGKIVIQQPIKMNELDSNSSYLITGGLGGLGLKITQWLIQKGAKNIVLVNRRMPDAADEMNLSHLRKDGVEILCFQADVSDEKKLNELLVKFGTELPKLKGIIHAAGVLEDGLFPNQNWQTFEKVFSPKIKGAWNLHKLTLKNDLDFFILFSSVASVLGSPGQANYAAANHFLDQLANYRRKLGLPANSINWGPWAEVGMANHLHDMHAKKGMNPLQPDQALSLLDEALKKDPSQIVIASIHWEKLKKEIPPLPFLEEVTNFSKQANQIIFPNIKEANPSERLALLQNGLKQGLSNILGLDLNQITLDADFQQLGMDSLMALELRTLLESNLGKDILNPETLFENSTIEKLSLFLFNKITPTTTSNEEEPVTITSSLTEEDINQIQSRFKKLTYPSFYRRLITTTARKIFFTVCKHYFKLTVTGFENLPKEGSFILCANHTSYLDGMALRLATKSKRLVGLFAQEYYSSPVYPWVALLSDTVPFDRTPSEYALQKNLKYIELCQEANRIIVIFPEGTRSKDGTLQEFKNGIAWFAHQSKLKIVPVLISGAAKLMPRGSGFPKPGSLSVHFGKPTDFASQQLTITKNKLASVYQEFTHKLRNSILELSDS